MFDLKVIHSVLGELEEERGIPRAKMIDAIEQALATAYKKEFGKRGQIVTAHFDLDTGDTVFNQIKIVVDESMLRADDDLTEDEAEDSMPDNGEEPKKVRFDEEKHIMVDTARMIKRDVTLGDELIFPLESKADFGRIAAQTAKQVIVQKIREAEKESALAEFGQKAGDIVIGQVQRFERGNLYVDLGRITAVMPYDEQIPGERFKAGERIRALLVAVEETPRGVFLRLSRAHNDFLAGLFAIEVPELQNGAVEVKSIAREAGARSKIAVHATDSHIDPVGSLVGQRGARVSTVMSELGGEKIDIIEWSPDPVSFIEAALSPARTISIKIITEPNETAGDRGHVVVEVAPDQQSLAIGRGGQNVRLAAKLTGWKIDIVSTQTGIPLAEADQTGHTELVAPSTEPVGAEADDLEAEDGMTTAPIGVADDEPTTDRDAGNPNDDEMDEIDTPEEAESLMATEEVVDETKN